MKNAPRAAIAAGFLLLWASLPVAARNPPTLLVMGDSLSAGYGIPFEASWVKQLQDRLRAKGYPHQVVNGSVSGESTAGGLSRLPKALETHQPDVVLIELGANDGLRGLPLRQLRENLREMVRLSRKRGAEVALFEMRIPPNMGPPSYVDAFTQTFHTVAKEEGAVVVPFFLEAIVAQPDAFLEDRLHPAASAQDELLEAVWPTLAQLLGGPVNVVHPKPAAQRSTRSAR